MRRILRVSLGVALVGGLIGLAAVWLLFQHRPGWYRPAVPDEVTVQRARTDTAAVADFIGDQMVRRRPFDVTLADHAVNDWLAALPRLYPDAQHSLPPEITSSAVRFDAGLAYIGAHLVDDGLQAIVSIALEPTLSDDGRTVTITLREIHAGSLPLPRRALQQLLDQVHGGSAAQRSGANRSERSLDSALRDVRSVDELFEGVVIRNRFVWPNGERPFRIDAITIDDGELRLRIEPL